MAEDEAVVYDFVTELTMTQRVDETFARAKKVFNDQQIVDDGGRRKLRDGGDAAGDVRRNRAARQAAAVQGRGEVTPAQPHIRDDPKVDGMPVVRGATLPLSATDAACAFSSEDITVRVN